MREDPEELVSDNSIFWRRFNGCDGSTYSVVRLDGLNLCCLTINRQAFTRPFLTIISDKYGNIKRLAFHLREKHKLFYLYFKY